MCEPENRKSRGRPRIPKELKKKNVTLRMEPELAQRIRNTGPGWQTRIVNFLRKLYNPTDRNPP